MAELELCPFCGGTPEFENTDERARLRCSGCGTEGGLFFFSQEECESGISDETEARAIEAWNRRTCGVRVDAGDRAVMQRSLDTFTAILGDMEGIGSRTQLDDDLLPEVQSRQRELRDALGVGVAPHQTFSHPHGGLSE